MNIHISRDGRALTADWPMIK
eukprot:COSAG01_NODE_31125_length_603_cov_1.126984_2_plen_20_part_01